MRKKTVFLSILFIIFLTLDFSNAAKSQDKIGFVNFRKILENTEQGKQAKRKLEDELSQSKISYEEKKLAFMKFNEELKKQQEVLSEDALKAKKEEFVNMQSELQRMGDELQYKLEKLKINLLKDLVKSIKDIIDEVAKSKGFALVLLDDQDPFLESGFILYGHPSVDLTDDVIKILNEKKTITKEDKK